MFVGNLRAHKNLRIVLDAMTRVPDATLRALLPADEHEEARAVLASRGLERRVQLLAGLDDDQLARQYRGATATVMPSTLEGFGLPALESIMTGTPVFYWQGCAAVAETVVGHGTAVGSADDPGEWAYAIGKAFATPRRVEPPSSGYDWDETAARIDETLVSLGATIR
jgi:glycosyltransferase involved in cell wall biosynthesis